MTFSPIWPYSISAQDMLSQAMTPLPQHGYSAQSLQMTPAYYGPSHSALSDSLQAALARQTQVPGLLAQSQAQWAQHQAQFAPPAQGLLAPNFYRANWAPPPAPPAPAVDPNAAAADAAARAQVARMLAGGSYSGGGSANGATGSGGDSAGGVSGSGGVGGSASDGAGGSAAAGTGGDDGGTY